jgi:hypothetical protein
LTADFIWSRNIQTNLLSLLDGCHYLFGQNSSLVPNIGLTELVATKSRACSAQRCWYCTGAQELYWMSRQFELQYPNAAAGVLKSGDLGLPVCFRIRGARTFLVDSLSSGQFFARALSDLSSERSKTNQRRCLYPCWPYTLRCLLLQPSPIGRIGMVQTTQSTRKNFRSRMASGSSSQRKKNTGLKCSIRWDVNFKEKRETSC